MNLTPKEARILLILLESKTAYEGLKEAIAAIYGHESDKKITLPRTIKRKIKNLYMSQFK
jgi:DNA-binding CsgD family transcriptional regulator